MKYACSKLVLGVNTTTNEVICTSPGSPGTSGDFPYEWGYDLMQKVVLISRDVLISGVK